MWLIHRTRSAQITSITDNTSDTLSKEQA
jgi:hypothetical protein